MNREEKERLLTIMQKVNVKLSLGKFKEAKELLEEAETVIEFSHPEYMKEMMADRERIMKMTEKELDEYNDKLDLDSL